MAERRPLVIGADGCPEELPVGDTLPGGDDEQSGYYFVPSGTDWTIEVNFQAITNVGLDLEGNLLLDGRLFLEL